MKGVTTVTAIRKPQKKEKPSQLEADWVFFIRCLAVTYSHMGTPTLPSALHRFTAEFGMGSGGSSALLPPGKRARGA